MNKNRESKKVLVVPHTHWDREWYVTFEEFRCRLIDMIDQLIETCLAEPEFIFTLDGQTVVIDDYLEVRPENKEVVLELIRQKRILVGPWYTQCDTRLINGESIVRNLLTGTTKADSLGNTCRIGYLPDNFGNIGQLPQILAGFDIDSFISSRGIDCPRNEFRWIGDDGTEILGVFQRFGYPTYNLDRRLRDPENATDKFKENIARLDDFEASDVILLGVGGDHCFPERELVEYVRHAAGELNIDMRIGSYQDYAKMIGGGVGKYPVVRGELNTAASRYLHASGVLAARMPVKRENRQLENMLIFQAEPLSIMASLLAGKKYENEYFELAWKNLMQNHAHDSIYGCCIDEVYNDVMPRFFKTRQIARQIIKGATRSIGTAIEPFKTEIRRIVVFNSLPFDRCETVRLKVALPGKTSGFEVVDAGRQEIRFCCEKIPAGQTARSSLEEATREFMLSFQASVPACGYAAFYLLPATKSRRPPTTRDNTPSFENRFYKAEISPDGSLNLYDKENDKEYSRLNHFVDGGNTGDLFTYSPPPEDTLICSLNAAAVVSVLRRDDFGARIKVALSMKVPQDLSGSKRTRLKRTAKLQITTVYTFHASSQRIDIETVFWNRVLNHRLRVHFPLPEDVATADADAQFLIQKRKSGGEAYPFVWDKPQGLHPAHGFIQAGQENGLTVATGETSQYEVSDKQSEIILTLLLGTGKFRECKNVLTRKQSWDNPVPTPDAQCLGKHAYGYSIIPGSGRKARRQALCAMHPLMPSCLGYEKGDLPGICSLFSTDNPEIRMSALKRHHENDNVILRLYNPSSEPADTNIFFSEFQPAKYRFVKLNEQAEGESFRPAENPIALSFAKGEIKTIELKSCSLVLSRRETDM